MLNDQGGNGGPNAAWQTIGTDNHLSDYCANLLGTDRADSEQRGSARTQPPVPSGMGGIHISAQTNTNPAKIIVNPKGRCCSITRGVYRGAPFRVMVPCALSAALYPCRVLPWPWCPCPEGVTAPGSSSRVLMEC